jgi:hypothetical protein
VNYFALRGETHEKTKPVTITQFALMRVILGCCFHLSSVCFSALPLHSSARERACSMRRMCTCCVVRSKHRFEGGTMALETFFLEARLGLFSWVIPHTSHPPLFFRVTEAGMPVRGGQSPCPSHCETSWHSRVPSTACSCSTSARCGRASTSALCVWLPSVSRVNKREVAANPEQHHRNQM